jgi:hypothetical protein
MYPDSIHALHTDVIFENLESSSPEILRHRLQESTEMIQQLSRHVNVINMELEKVLLLNAFLLEKEIYSFDLLETYSNN